jgi:putative flippase GtrA
MIDLRGAARFLRYSSVGVSTFLLDLLLLFALIDGFGMHHVLAAGLAFLIAVSVNFLVSRRFAFRGSERPFGKSYVAFLLIAGVATLAIAGLMYVAVDLLILPVLVSRVAIAGIVGIFNYLANLYLNFKVAGK